LDKLQANDKDLETRFAFAKWLFEHGGDSRQEEAIEECMKIMTQDKKWNDKAAYNLLIEIFNKMGPKNDKVIAARKRLSKILF
jgi:putative thioredoxin